MRMHNNRPFQIRQCSANNSREVVDGDGRSWIDEIERVFLVEMLSMHVSS